MNLDAMEMKERSTKQAQEAVIIDAEEAYSGSGRRKDGAALARVGKKQQLERNFGFFSILALSSTLLASWETICSIFAVGLINGGPVAMVYGMMLSLTGTMAMAASLSEMSSMAPVASAQYHFTALFSPPRYAAFISWVQGWITVFAWQATSTSVTFLTATQIQGLLVLNYPSYVFQRWHGTLLMWALLALTWVVNVFGIRLLPLIELIGGLCHVAFFVALIIPLVLLSPRSTAEFVFTQSLDQSGWNNSGVSWCVGLLTVTFCFVGFDGSMHMSEEVRKASTTVPKVIIISIIVNGIMAFGMVLTLLFCVGDIDAALSTPTGYPIIQIFYQATGSVSGATVMMCAIIIISFCSSFGILASTSRLTWAFARDRGLPFSGYFAAVNARYRIPIRAISLTTAIIMVLSFINIGSSTALNAIISLSTLALYISYLIPIALLVSKRMRGDNITFGPFNLGRLGLATNVFALVFGVFICIFLPFPSVKPVTSTNMNYASPVFGFVLLFAICDWFVRGRKVYTGPLREVPYDSDSNRGGSTLPGSTLRSI